MRKMLLTCIFLTFVPTSLPTDNILPLILLSMHSGRSAMNLVHLLEIMKLEIYVTININLQII